MFLGCWQVLRVTGLSLLPMPQRWSFPVPWISKPLASNCSPGEYRTVGEFEAFDRAFSEDVAGGVADAQGEIAVDEPEAAFLDAGAAEEDVTGGIGQGSADVGVVEALPDVVSGADVLDAWRHVGGGAGQVGERVDPVEDGVSVVTGCGRIDLEGTALNLYPALAVGVEDRVEALAGEFPIGVEALATVERVAAVAVEVVGFGDAGESFSLVGAGDDVAEIRARLREVDGFAEVDSGVAGDVLKQVVKVALWRICHPTEETRPLCKLTPSPRTVSARSGAARVPRHPRSRARAFSHAPFPAIHRGAGGGRGCAGGRTWPGQG